MTRTKTIFMTGLRELTNEQLTALANIADAFARDMPDEDETTRAAIVEGIAQADRGEFATDEEVAMALARFRLSSHVMRRDQVWNWRD